MHTANASQNREVNGAFIMDNNNTENSFVGQSNGRALYGSSDTIPSINGTPRPLIPGRKPATPVQAYAGPTFHASPAPSSLPIPKFFSRSVPDREKSNSLKAMMDKDLSDTSVDNSEGSPTPESPSHAVGCQIREDSPLDIFFRADREEKAKANQDGVAKSTARDVCDGQTITGKATRTMSSSPLRNTISHARHPTDGSVPNVFSFEMDNAPTNGTTTKSIVPGPFSQNRDIRCASITSFDPINQAAQEEELRKVQTQGLKKLLFSPQPPRPGSSTPRPRTSLSSQDDSLGLSSRQTPTTRDAFGSSMPAPVIRSESAPSNCLPHISYPFVPRPLPVTATSSGSPRPRPTSSSLRKEIIPTNTTVQLDLLELPSASTPSRSRKPDNPTQFQNHRNVRINGTIPPTTSTLALDKPSAEFGKGPARDSGFVKSVMEDDLRRILKLNLLRSDV